MAGRLREGEKAGWGHINVGWLVGRKKKRKQEKRSNYRDFQRKERGNNGDKDI